MEYLNWDLDVLSRAIVYTNLSGAAQHIGISQPQLSRIVSKLEERYGIVLLNRESKRKSTWTHDAFTLVENYKQACHQFQSAVNQLNEEAIPKKIMIASLEGMTIFAVQLAKFAFKNLGISEVTIDILDLNKIEEYFLKNRYDFILSQRTPGRTKYEYVMPIGFQTIDFNMSKNEETLVLSSFEKSSKLSLIHI